MEQVGYARVFLHEERQALDRQMDALKAAGCRRVFDDRGSGAGTDRPGLRACLDCLRRGDVLVVLDLDRLGRLAGELIHLLDGLEARGVGFRALNAPFDTTTLMGRAFLQVQAAFAEMERSVIHQRVRRASPPFAHAAARGAGGGRPRLITPERLRHAQHLMADQNHSIPAICRELGGIPASTLYHYLRADGTLKAPGVALLGTEPSAVANPPLEPGLAHKTLLIFSPVLICSPF